jgi:hypothetical protein
VLLYRFLHTVAHSKLADGGKKGDLCMFAPLASLGLRAVTTKRAVSGRQDPARIAEPHRAYRPDIGLRLVIGVVHLDARCGRASTAPSYAASACAHYPIRTG